MKLTLRTIFGHSHRLDLTPCAHGPNCHVHASGRIYRIEGDAVFLIGTYNRFDHRGEWQSRETPTWFEKHYFFGRTS